MEKHLDISKALRVYNIVTSNGIKKQEKYQYQGLSAWGAVDGYTVHLSDETVTLSIYFHNKFEIEHKNSKQLDAFIKKLGIIDSKAC